MKKIHHKYVNNSKSEEMFQKFIKEKLVKNIQNVEREMCEICEVGGRSSVSSSSFAGNYALEDWLQQEREEKLIKEQQKLID